MYRSSTYTPALALALTLTLFLCGLPQTSASVPLTPPPPAKDKESCATCPVASKGKAEGSINDLATLGRRTQQLPLSPVQRSIFDGARINLVSTSDGSLTFAVTDIEIPGVMPLIFQRVYSSDRSDDRGLGGGWTFAYDDSIKIMGDEALMSTASSSIAFRREGAGSRFVLKTAEPGLHQSFEEAQDGTLIEQTGGYRRTYRKIDDAYRLARLADADGNAVEISFNSKGNVTRIASSSGRWLTLSWSAGRQPRLLSVGDNIGRRVSFTQGRQGLTGVTDQAGAQWTYGYASGQLTRAADPMGRVVLRARYDKLGRAAESGDAVGTYHFSYGDPSPHQTVVTDPLGVKSFFIHTGQGAVASVSDEEGQTSRVEYDGANRPTRVSDSLGNEAKLAGASPAPVPAANDTAAGYNAVRNERGQTLSLQSAGGGRRVNFEYNASGDRTAYIFSDAGRFETKYDAAGRKTGERLPSGLSSVYEYDAHGKVGKVTDSKGNRLTVERDASGLVVRVIRGDAWVSATRDEAGRVTRMDNSEGKSRRFAYDARGALTNYVDARGIERKFTYDRQGRVTGSSSGGLTLRYRYDRNGKLAGVQRITNRESRDPVFVRAGYGFALPTIAAPQDNDTAGGDCPFGYDGTFHLNNNGEFVNNCYDPFGVLGGVGGSGGSLGGGYLNGGETRDQCISRHVTACTHDYNACIAAVTGVSITVVVGCLALTATLAFLVCVGGGVLIDGVGIWGCEQSKMSCILRAPDGCPL